MQYGADDNVEVINMIRNDFGNSHKGSNRLPANYFLQDGTENGRCFKVSMLFRKALDGEQMHIRVGMKDIDNNVFYLITPPYTPNVTSDLSNFTLAKLECYLSVFWESGNSKPYLYVTGDVKYANSMNGSDIRSMPLNNGIELSGGTGVVHDIVIVNRSVNKIYPVHLMIDEIV
jgi:hypothetical protein